MHIYIRYAWGNGRAVPYPQTRDAGCERHRSTSSVKDEMHRMVASIELGSLASKNVVFAVSGVKRQIERSVATPSYPSELPL
jgi:hypothetical protein